MTGYYVDPSRKAFDVFKALPRDTPIQMLNLIRYREIAAYPDGHEHFGKEWSGEEAYREYGKSSGPIFARVGGHIVWRGVMEAMLTGPDDRQWDLAFIAAYPDSAAFFEMIKDPDYQKAVVNRQAAVLDSRLIRFKPLAVEGQSFV
ncbi:MAG: DUF1330 domain-containing protein [Sphingomonadales bacterium]|nr:DUF1330 domain-containing protein [Sphingomonadales bacterium]